MQWGTGQWVEETWKRVEMGETLGDDYETIDVCWMIFICEVIKAITLYNEINKYNFF